MGIIYADSFDDYATQADVKARWSSDGGAINPWTIDTTGGKNGRGCATANSATQASLFAPIVPGTPGTFFGNYNSNVACCAFLLKIASPPAAETFFWRPQNGYGCFIQIMNIGIFRLYSSASTSLAFGQTNVCDNKWHWVEIYDGITAASTQRCQVDGIWQWSGTFNSAVTQNYGGFNQLVNVTSRATSIDNFICWDDAWPGAPTAASWPLGQKAFFNRRPASDASVQFTPDSGGSNYSRINAAGLGLADTSYVQSGVNGAIDYYNYQPLGHSPTSFLGVYAHAQVRSSGRGTRSFRQNAKSGASVTNGTTRNIPTWYRGLGMWFPTDPQGGAAWTQSRFDAANFGVEVIS